MIGTATTPLMTAVQNSIVIGSIVGRSERGAAERRRADDGVEAERAARRQLEAAAQSERLGHRVGGRPASTGTASKPVPMMPSGEQREREIAGDRPQRFGGLRRGIDLGDTVRVQRRGRGDDDEEGNRGWRRSCRSRCRSRCAEVSAPCGVPRQ